MTDARELTTTLGGRRRWAGAGVAAMARHLARVCQPEGRKGQNAVTLSDGTSGRLVLDCKKTGCAFLDILVSLYCLTIARSGERKSACDAPLMTALRAHEKEAAKAQRDAMERWGNAHAIWKGIRDRILAEAKKGKGERRTAAQADLEALGPEPAAPPRLTGL